MTANTEITTDGLDHHAFHVMRTAAFEIFADTLKAYEEARRRCDAHDPDDMEPGPEKDAAFARAQIDGQRFLHARDLLADALPVRQVHVLASLDALRAALLPTDEGDTFGKWVANIAAGVTALTDSVPTAHGQDPFLTALDFYRGTCRVLNSMSEKADKAAYEREEERHIEALRQMEQTLPISPAGLIASMEAFLEFEVGDLAEGQAIWFRNMLTAARALV